MAATSIILMFSFSLSENQLVESVVWWNCFTHIIQMKSGNLIIIVKGRYYHDNKSQMLNCIVNLTHCVLLMQYDVQQIFVNIGSGNGLVPNKHHAITWTYDNSLLIVSFEKKQINSSKQMHLKMSSALCQPFWPGLNMLMTRNGSLFDHIMMINNAIMYFIAWKPVKSFTKWPIKQTIKN